MQDAVYGGRVDNAYDTRVLEVYLQRYFDPRLITGEQKELADGLSLPASNRHADYLRIVESLHDVTAPPFLGLPSNVERTLQRRKSADTVRHLMRLTATSADSQSATR